MIRGFTVKQLLNLKPVEDSYGFKEMRNTGIMAVADGITRDPHNIPMLPNRKSIIGMLRFSWNYERPSRARRAADIFVRDFIWNAEGSLRYESPSITLLDNLFKKGNKSIQDYNREIGLSNNKVDYLENDFAGCVAATAIFTPYELFWGSIADSRVMVFTPKGDIRFASPKDGPNSKGSIDKDMMNRWGITFVEPSGRKKVRQYYRNNPKEPLSYGALTGEQKADYYIRSGELELREGEAVVAFTDGLEKVVESNKFAEAIKNRSHKRIYKTARAGVENEGTLTYSFITHNNSLSELIKKEYVPLQMH